MSDDEWDPYSDEYVDDRDDIVLDRGYRSVDIRRVIWELQSGDVVEIEVTAESYPDRTLTVTGQRHGDVIAVDDDDKEFLILPEYWGRNFRYDGQPWLRVRDGNTSAGQIHELTVIEFGD